MAQNLLRLRKALQFMQGLLFKRVIFVFQMGKVGSLSAFVDIQRSLEEQEGQRFQQEVINIRSMGMGDGKVGLIHSSSKYILIHGHMIGGFYNFIIRWRAKLGLPLSVICPIREPIARDVSAFFAFYVGRSLDLFAGADMGELEELFLAVPSHRQVSRNRAMAEHQFTLNWFDEHFKPQLHIDVYKQPFPKDRKWQIYRRGFTRVLVYRIDLKRSEQAKLISRFLGIKLDETRLKNAGKNKNYAELYSRFHESVKLPEQYIRRMHDSRFAQHFWSPQELKAAADKWRATPSN